MVTIKHILKVEVEGIFKNQKDLPEMYKLKNEVIKQEGVKE